MNVPIRVKGDAQPQAPAPSFSFRYGDERIAFERVQRRQVSGKVLIKVHPDCRVVVSAPREATDDAVLAAVKQRGRWIYQQLRDFRQQLEHVTPRQYISGESHYYLGKQYLLKVIEAPDSVQGVKMLRGKLEVSVRQRSAEKVRELLADWYKARAKEVFARRLNAMLDQAIWVTGRPALRILTMQTQWGSCSPPWPDYAQPTFGQSTPRLYRLRDPARALPYRRAQPQRALLPADESGDARLGKDQSEAGWHG